MPGIFKKPCYLDGTQLGGTHNPQCDDTLEDDIKGLKDELKDLQLKHTNLTAQLEIYEHRQLPSDKRENNDVLITEKEKQITEIMKQITEIMETKPHPPQVVVGVVLGMPRCPRANGRYGS